MLELDDDSDDEIKVVGESHYRKNLLQVAGPGGQYGVRVNTEAALVPEPKNRHDRNAVRVDIDGRTVGYLPRDVAAVVSPALLGANLGFLSVPAYISAGWDGGDYSVTIEKGVGQVLALLGSGKGAAPVAATPQPKKQGCLFWVVVVFAVLVLGAVARALFPALSTPVERAKIAETPVAAVSLPTPTPAPALLGSEYAIWAAAYGEPTEGSGGYQVYGDWEILDFGAGRAQHVERQYDPAAPIDTVLADVAAILPADSVLVSEYSPEGRPEAKVSLYSSASLATLLPDSAWSNAGPGQFIVIYKVFDEGVQRVIVGTGNNP
jgi:hypothetical protein